MRSHEKSHSNNLHTHFPCVDEQEDEINCVNVLCDGVDLLIEGQEGTVNKNNKQDKSVEPWVDRHDLNDLVTEWICHRQAAKRHSCVVLLLAIIWHV